MTIKIVEAFETSDGSIFTDEDEARAYDKQAQIKKRLEDLFDMHSIDEFSGTDAYWTFEMLWEHKDTLLHILSGKGLDDDDTVQVGGIPL